MLHWASRNPGGTSGLTGPAAMEDGDAKPHAPDPGGAARRLRRPGLRGRTPDVAGLTLETTGGPADGLPGAPLLSRNAAAVSATCQDWEYLCLVQEGVAGLNAFVRAAVEPVEQPHPGVVGDEDDRPKEALRPSR